MEIQLVFLSNDQVMITFSRPLSKKKHSLRETHQAAMIKTSDSTVCCGAAAKHCTVTYMHQYSISCKSDARYQELLQQITP